MKRAAKEHQGDQNLLAYEYYRDLNGRTRWREALQIAAAFLLTAIISVCVLAIVANHFKV